MSNVNDVGDRATKLIRWLARGWGILVIVSVSFIVIGFAWNWVTTGETDRYAVEDYPPIENLPLIFSFLSAIGLGIAWRWEGLGGAIAVVSQLATLLVLLIHWPIAQGFPRYLVAPYGVWAMIAIPGVLFLVCWWRSRPRTSARHSV